MGSFGQVKLKDVFRMLAVCAKGYRAELKLHHYWVYYGDTVFLGLPKGPGKSDLEAEIPFGKVATMARQLGFSLDCAKKELYGH